MLLLTAVERNLKVFLQAHRIYDNLKIMTNFYWLSNVLKQAQPYFEVSCYLDTSIKPPSQTFYSTYVARWQKLAYRHGDGTVDFCIQN